jgi:flagellin
MPQRDRARDRVPEILGTMTLSNRRDRPNLSAAGTDVGVNGSGKDHPKMQVNTNIGALSALRNLSVNDSATTKSIERLSSGFRINRAGDDAAGLVISEGLRSQIGGLKVAMRNAQDGISVAQTAEGALNEVHSILQRMRDLAVQSANGSNSADAQDALNAEVTQLKAELDRIGNTTNFNGVNLLDAATTLDFQVGSTIDADNTISIDTVDATSTGLAVNAIDIGSTGDAAAAQTAIDTAINTVSTSRASFGAAQNRFEHTIASLGVAVENLSASESRIRDVDMAAEMAELTKRQVLTQAGTAMVAQANSSIQSVVNLLR